MNQSCKLPSFDVAFSGLYSGTLDIINQSCERDASKQQHVYQGMSGQTLNSPFPVYNSQSQSETGILKSLHEYDIVSLAESNPENSFGTGIHEIPKSVLDKYVPWNSDDEIINNEILSIPDFTFAQQVCLSVSEPDPIPDRHLNPDDQLTHLHAVLFNRQDVPPVTFVNPTNLNQTTSDEQTTPLEKIADSFLVEHQRERMQESEKRKQVNQQRMKRYREMMKNPEKRNLINQRYRERMQKPEKRKLVNQQRRKRYSEKMKDPEKRKLINQRQREQYNKRKKDPKKRNLINKRQREQRQDPEGRKLINQRQRELRQDPEKIKLLNQRQRELYYERMKDPIQRNRLNQRQKDRMKDPEKRNLRNQQRRE